MWAWVVDNFRTSRQLRSSRSQMRSWRTPIASSTQPSFFLVNEDYWFGVEAADPEANEAELGAIRGWTSRHDRAKLRGFYVDVSKTGDVMKPGDVADKEMLERVLAAVHQIGWQLRLGEHIEGKRQDQQEEGIPAASAELIQYMSSLGIDINGREDAIPGTPLRNASYRFNDPEKKSSEPFQNMGKPGYEAETRELLALMVEHSADSGPLPDGAETPPPTNEDEGLQ